MQRFIAVLAFTVTATAIGVSPGVARAMPAGNTSRPAIVQTVFHLQVSGTVAPGTTFWVAYGPLAGKFGLVRLEKRSAGVYEASRTLPTDGRTLFSYIAGHGTIHTRAGVAPGNPVVTLRRYGPTSVWPKGIPALKWFAPAG